PFTVGPLVPARLGAARTAPSATGPAPPLVPGPATPLPAPRPRRRRARMAIAAVPLAATADAGTTIGIGGAHPLSTSERRPRRGPEGLPAGVGPIRSERRSQPGRQQPGPAVRAGRVDER